MDETGINGGDNKICEHFKLESKGKIEGEKKDE